MIRRAIVEHAKNQIWCSDVSLVNARKKSAKPRKKNDRNAFIGKDIVMNGDTYIYNGNLYLTGDIHK